jgi:hypothetical protein
MCVKLRSVTEQNTEPNGSGRLLLKQTAASLYLTGSVQQTGLKYDITNKHIRLIDPQYNWR